MSLDWLMFPFSQANYSKVVSFTRKSRVSPHVEQATNVLQRLQVHIQNASHLLDKLCAIQSLLEVNEKSLLASSYSCGRMESCQSELSSKYLCRAENITNCPGDGTEASKRLLSYIASLRGEDYICCLAHQICLLERLKTNLLIIAIF